MAEPAPADQISTPAAMGVWATLAFGGLLCVLFGTWAVASPLMGVPDEPAHTVKAASVWQGQLRGERTQIEGTAGMNGPGEVFVDTVRVPEAFASAHDVPGCWAFFPSRSAACAPDLEDSGETVDATTTAGTYPPLYYALVGWPSRIVANDGGAYMMRLASAAICAALIAFAARSLSRMVPMAVAVMGSTLAITPMVPFLAGSINPAGLEFAASMLFWCAALVVVSRMEPGKRLGRPVVAELLIGFTVLCWTRGLGLVFAMVALLAVLAFAGFGRVRVLVADRRTWMLGGVMAAVAGVGALWVLSNGQFDAVVGGELPEGTRPMLALFTSVDDFYQQMIAIFGWKDTGPVTFAVLAWTLAISLVLGAALLYARVRQRTVLLVLSAAVVLLPVLFQFRSIERDGLAWQGRYILPVAVGVPVLAAVCVAPALRQVASGLRALFGVALVAWAVAMNGSLYAWLHRSTVGQSPDLLNPFSWNGWAPPVGPGWLLVLSISCCAVLTAAVVVEVGREGRDRRGALPGTAAGSGLGAGGDEVVPEEPRAQVADTVPQT